MGITRAIRPVIDNAELEAIVALQRRAWGMDDLTLTPPHIFRAVVAANGQLLGAFEPDGRLVGFTMALLASAPDGSPYFYSHLAAVDPSLQDAGVGFELKQGQRRNALDRGISVIRWAYDPMEARNAHLNIAKLGAVAVSFVPDYYGELPSTTHGGFPTDRFIVEWNLRAPPVIPQWDEALPVLRVVDGETVDVDLPARPLGQNYILDVPLNFQALKHDRRPFAVAWHEAVRAACTRIFGDRYRAVSFQRDHTRGLGRYLLVPRASDEN